MDTIQLLILGEIGNAQPSQAIIQLTIIFLAINLGVFCLAIILDRSKGPENQLSVDMNNSKIHDKAHYMIENEMAEELAKLLVKLEIEERSSILDNILKVVEGKGLEFTKRIDEMINDLKIKRQTIYKE